MNIKKNTHQFLSPKSRDGLNENHRAATQKEAKAIDGQFQDITDSLVDVDGALDGLSANDMNPTSEELSRIKNWQRKRASKGGLRGKKVAGVASATGLVGGAAAGKVALGLLTKGVVGKALGLTAIATAGPIVGGIALGVAGAVAGWSLVRGNEAQVDKVREKLDKKEQNLKEIETDLNGLQEQAEATISQAESHHKAREESLMLWQGEIADLEATLAYKTTHKDQLVQARVRELRSS